MPRLVDLALNRVVDPVVLAVLRSPLHGALSRRVAVLELAGRRTGRVIRVPVSYTDVPGGLAAVSSPRRRWWRNLRGGAPVRVLLRGRWHEARADATVAGGTVAVRIVVDDAAREPEP
jgi:hypothetical protein